MRKLLIAVLFLNAGLLGVRCWEEFSAAQAGRGRSATENGDTNGDGARDISDAVYFLSWLFQGGPEPVAVAQESGALTVEQAEILSHMSLVSPADDPCVGGKTIRFSGVNVQVVNGLESTGQVDFDGASPWPSVVETSVNGVGNLIVGYQESRNVDRRSGSHNLVVGSGNDYTAFGGLVIGFENAITGPYASVSGGAGNVASGFSSTVGGGRGNQATGGYACAVGGGTDLPGLGNPQNLEDRNRDGAGAGAAAGNVAAGDWSCAFGGASNTATGHLAIVLGRFGLTAVGESSIDCTCE